MAGNNMKIDGELNLQLNIGAESAKKQLLDLQQSLKQVSNIQLNVGQETLTDEIQKASQAALELSTHLTKATNLQTGNLDFTKFTHSLSTSEKDISKYTESLLAIGNQGKRSFVNLANSIASSEIPLKRTSKLLDNTWDNLKKTIGWQFSSSLVHGFIGSIQQAVGYAQDLNKSLTDIRIVTGQSSEQMALFAREANAAAKNLSTTTTDYTKASLIYYQQGLSEAEVKERTETTIKMANATGTSAQKVSDQMTAIWNNYDNGTKSLTHYADVMTALGAATASSTDEIAQGLQKFASISDTVGLSYEYAAAALATVTATSRESADVVGNSFKTLFSRIQGLQLGETLDDGTDLNKYSAALSKVGISIKDASGGLKDMDDILDEMGGKWETLGRDQQMALAQTVAGVRQYTQLMTLMENWDYFKQNLNIANSSTGTLDQQAAIYAESWEAASNRVRASWEGLWDSFINSDSFITALDGFSKIISAMDTLISSMGGGGSALAAFGGILTRVFKPQLTKTIADTAYNLKMMMPGAQRKIEEQRSSILGSMQKAITEERGFGKYESDILQKNLSSAMRLSLGRAEKRRNMTEQEVLLSENLETQLSDIRTDKHAIAQSMDMAETAMQRFSSDDINRQFLDSIYVSKDRLKAEQELTEARQAEAKYAKSTGLKNHEKGMATKQQQTQEAEQRVKNLWDSELNKGSISAAIESAAEQGASFAEKFKKNLWDNTDRGLKGDVLDYAAIAENMKQYAEENNLLDGNKIEELFKDIGQGGKLKGDNSDSDRRKIREIAEEVSKSGMTKVIEGLDLNDEQKKIVSQYANSQYDFITGQRKLGVLNTVEGDLEQQYQNLGSKKTGNIEDFVNGAEGLLDLLASGQSLNAFAQSLQNGTATFSSSLTSIISTLATGVIGFAQLRSALGGISALSAGAATGIGLIATALLTLGPVIADWIDSATVSQKEYQASIMASNNELNNAVATSKNVTENVKNQIDNYQNGIDELESNIMQDPLERSKKVRESNQQALDLINTYDLDSSKYTTTDEGLIVIQPDSLFTTEEQQLKKSNNIERSNLMKNFDLSDINDILNIAANNMRQELGIDYTEDSVRRAYNNYQTGQNVVQWEGWKKQFGEQEWFKNAENALSTEYNETAAVRTTMGQTIVTDADIDSTSDGYSSLVNHIGETYIKNYNEALESSQFNPKTLAGELNETQAAFVEEYLKGLGYTDIEIGKAEDGAIKFTSAQGEGSVQTKTMQRVEAEQQAYEQSLKEVSEYQKKIKDYNDIYKDMGEAILSIEEFGSAAKASANSVQSLYENWESYQKSIINEQTSAANNAWQNLEKEEQNRISQLFGPGGIVEALGLNSETLSRVNNSTLEILQNQIEGMGAEGASYIGELFAGLKEATGAETAEDIAKIVTALSSMDFSDSAYSNLLNLKSTLEAFGFDVDTSGLEALYAILAKLAGLSPGGGIEDLADTNKKITENRGALNQIAPDQAVDQATRDAGVAAGLNANDFVKDENGNYVYNGSQQDIKYAKGITDRAFASNQFLTNQAQYFYEDAFGDNVGQTYESFQDLYDAAVALEPGVADFINKLGLDLSSTDSDIQNQILEAYNQAIENGQTSEETQQANIQDYMAQITSANDMMNAVRNNLFSGNGFIDENGIISDEVMARLDSFPATSERVAESFNALKAARENYQEAINDEDPNNDMDADNLYNQAMANYDLATAIDAVAEARGLDAEQVAFYTEQLQNSMDADELSRYSPDALADLGADLAEQKNAIDALNKAWGDLSSTLSKDELTEDKGKALKQLGKYLDQLTNSTLTAGKSFSDLDKGYKKFLADGGNMQKVLKGDRKEITKLARAMEGLEDQTLDSTSANKKYGKTYGDIYKAIDEAGEQIDDSLEEGLITPESFMGDAATQQQNYDALKSMLYNMTVDNMQRTGQSWEQAAAETAAATGYALVEGVNSGMDAGGLSSGEVGIDATPVQGNASNPPTKTGEPSTVWGVDYSCDDCGHGYYDHIPTAVSEQIPASQTTAPAMDAVEVHKLGDAPKGAPAGGGGGGGGGGKEPKKVAVKRKSQIVKRYKQNDFKREHAAHAKKSEENKKDYLYGEQKIAQLEKINKLAEKEAHITADRIKESREYLVEDRQNLINMLSKYGFEAEFDTDGFLANYEKVWNELYEEIAALYEDNLLTEEESKLEEEFNVKLEELEGALEDYENSLKELADDIEAYEESLYEIYDNKIEALEHKVEFKIELEEDDLEYLDFWIESLGDSVYNAIESIEAMGAKANMLFNGLNVYKQGIEDIYALSDDPFQIWATGGLEDVLTQDQVDLLRDNRDGLADYMQQLIDLREEIKDKVIDTFDLWTERIDANIASIEHYSSVIEYFKNMVDTIGKDPFGLSDQFVNQLEQSAINQSLDYIDSQKTYYESLVEQQAKAQEELDAARAREDESSAEHWEEVVRTTTEAMEEAQDDLLSGLDNILTLIAEQFETAMQRAVDAFNDAIYAYGGLESLSNDYDMIRENADLMAADYEKIYELSKLTRDINKVLDDTNIVAGKKKMNGLLKEINELQADGVELSKYDLEYLRAKYELRLAEIELENTQNSKDTVRLSKDSEGNWSYIYTQNADAVEEAEQKYEDALYEMQKLSQEYLEEMSGMMLETSQAMMEEISALRIQDFTSYEAYQTEVKRIQDKYAESLRHQENELNKAVQNSSDLYEQDWQAYNQATGYKISLAENWVDSFREATLGDILDINTFMSGFSDTFLGLTEQMSEQLADAAVQYFTNVDTAMKTYGTSIEGFGKTATTTIDSVSQKSKTAKDDLKVMASEMSDAFKEIADYVSDWQEEFSGQIDTMLEEIKELIQSINEAIRQSAELTDGKSGAEGLIGSEEAIELLNATGLFGSWSKDGSVGVKVDGKATNFVDYNGALIEEIDDAVARYANAKTGTEERERLGEELKELFKRYWQFRDIVNRVYDPTNLTTNMDAPTFTSMDTGGYTGEWGDSGKFAMLHEKELILNANDTKNFLDALNISRDVINSMIEMNARASSLALGDLFPSLVQDFGQTLEQTVTITAEFPDATDRNEIEEAFNNLLNTASQYANRNNT